MHVRWIDWSMREWILFVENCTSMQPNLPCMESTNVDVSFIMCSTLSFMWLYLNAEEEGMMHQPPASLGFPA